MPYDVTDLYAALPKIPQESYQFANDLIAKSKRYPLTPKQMYWVDELVKRAKGETVRQTVNVGDLTATIALFDKAASHLKFPKVLLTLGDKDIRLSIAGARSKFPGTINVTAVGRYGDTWYGRITRDGIFQPSAGGANVEGLDVALREFTADPSDVAARYGRLHGKCCFCSIPLKDERSTAVGYGKTCAAHWGLAWGHEIHDFKAA